MQGIDDELPCFDTSGDCPNHGKHYGKYQNCLAESVHYASMEGWADDEGGDVDGPGYYSLLLDMQAPDMGFPHPAYIVQCVSSGAVYVMAYDDPKDAEDEWHSVIEPELDAWYAQEEGD